MCDIIPWINCDLTIILFHDLNKFFISFYHNLKHDVDATWQRYAQAYYTQYGGREVGMQLRERNVKVPLVYIEAASVKCVDGPKLINKVLSVELTS